MKKKNHEFISKLMVTLLNVDKVTTYDFLSSELDVSKSTISEVKKGGDICIRHYIRVVDYVLNLIRLTVIKKALLRQIKQALKERSDIAVGVIPRAKNGVKNAAPIDWEVVAKWDN